VPLLRKRAGKLGLLYFFHDIPVLCIEAFAVPVIVRKPRHKVLPHLDFPEINRDFPEKIAHIRPIGLKHKVLSE
jgi:hypothetical protein